MDSQKKSPTVKGGKGGKSSKTDHVLHLLTGTPSPQIQNSPSPSPSPATMSTAIPPQSLPPTLPVLEVARNNNDRLSETIRSALEFALEEEKVDSTVVSSTQPPVESAASASPSTLDPREASPSTSPTGPDMKSETLKSSSPPSTLGFSPTTEKDTILPGNGIFLNIMELLVDESLEHYGKFSGLCPCSRCLADAKALALSRLPAKYVVLPTAAVAPMMGLYREEFRSDILAQVLFSCDVVTKQPRHNSPNSQN